MLWKPAIFISSNSYTTATIHTSSIINCGAVYKTYALLSMRGWKLDLASFPEQSWNVIPEKCQQSQQRTVETKSGTGDNDYT